MPRVNVVKKARKSQGTCGKCGDELKAGEPYRWWEFRYGGARKRCMKPTCSPRPSDLTQSKMAGVYQAQESASDSLHSATTVEDIAQSLRDAAEGIKEVAEEYRESASNIESGMNTRTYQCDELEEKADELETWADELESKADDIEGQSGEVVECEACEGTGQIGGQCTECAPDGTCNRVEDDDPCTCATCGGEHTQQCEDCDGTGQTDEDATNDKLEDIRTEADDLLGACPV